MQFEKVHSFIINKLEKELPKYLTYHNARHTKEVLHNARHIAHAENITGHELDILLTGALFHDTGFLETYKDHEAVSCNIARKYLPDYEYTHEEIEEVCDLIMATRIPQQAHNKLAEILCDADLAYMGTDKYFSTSKNLYRELKNLVIIKTNDEWVKFQTDFIESHNYFTKTASREHQYKKEQNLLILKTRAHQEKRRKNVHFNFSFLVDIVYIIIGVVTAAFALRSFLVPNHFFDGGMTGISLLIHELYHFDLAYVILLANLPFIILSMYVLNYSFAIKTFICIVLLGICLFYVPYDIVITQDKLLVSIFGGFFLGLGIGLTMRAGCAVDGIEVLALYAWRRTSFTISEIILALNIFIFGIAAFEFGIQTALYSMLTYFTASKTVDYVVEGIEAYTGVTIISSKSEIIKYRLVNELNRGITVYKGERGYLPGNFEVHENCDIIFTVITRLELRKLRNLVSAIDPKAFVFASNIREASGGIIKHRHIN
jgi:uncharacterized membrane-anchored protein YitT (DUF2179 family)